MAEGNYRYVTERAEEKRIPVMTGQGPLLQEIMKVLAKIKKLEAGHEDELMELAKQTVAREWDFDPSMFEAKKMDDVGGSGKPESHKAEKQEMTPIIKREIGKRLLTNTIKQGAGLHALLSFHHLASEEINRISPELLSLYDTFGNLISQSYYLLSPKQLDSMESMMGKSGTGWSHVEYAGENNPETKVVAQGLCFSIVCQELIKGLVGMQTDFNLDNGARQKRGEQPLSIEQQKFILNEADKLKFEPLKIQAGMELWRKFLDVIPDGVDKANVIGYLSCGSADALSDISRLMVSNPNEARDILVNIAKEMEDEEFGYEKPLEEEVNVDESEYEVEGVVDVDESEYDDPKGTGINNIEPAVPLDDDDDDLPPWLR